MLGDLSELALLPDCLRIPCCILDKSDIAGDVGRNAGIQVLEGDERTMVIARKGTCYGNQGESRQ